MHRSARVITAISALLLLVSGLSGAVTSAAPVESPRIEVFLDDGVTPVGNTVIHPGDELVVRGYGFDPNSNRNGFPVPVPPGVPHGTFVAFGAFAPDWRPSTGAPESARQTNRLGVQWALSPEALAQVPDAPFDMRRTIRQQWVPLNADGEFTARLVASTPKTIPAGARWGVYTYGAAGADNAAQELHVPVEYSTEPGPNTPAPAPQNLLWAYSPDFRRVVTENLQGSIYGVDGADVSDGGELTFMLTDNTISNGTGEVRFTGTVVAFTRFHLAEIAMADPVLRVDGERGVLSLRTSTTNTNGTDMMRRIDVADVTLTAAQVAALEQDGDISGLPVRFRPGITPELLALASVGPASPLTVDFTE